MRALIITAAAGIVLAGCATGNGYVSGGAGTGGIAALPAHTEAEFERDRQAILAMTGEYDVTFDFREIVPLRAGYELAEPKVSGAWEVVRVIEDRGDFISLQHFLLVGDDEDNPMVIKHWRQDWEYEPARIMDYDGNDDWHMIDLTSAEAAGTWSQSVYQVDDSPRYAAVARWTHDDDGISSSRRGAGSTNRTTPRSSSTKPASIRSSAKSG